MKKALLIVGLAMLALLGCRQVSNRTSNYITLQSQAGSIYLSHVELGEGDNDATQAADKDFGEAFSGNKGEAAIGPASKTGASSGTSGQ